MRTTLSPRGTPRHRAPSSRPPLAACRVRDIRTHQGSPHPRTIPPIHTHKPSPLAACRVWDIRTKVQVHCLSGHEDTVAAVLALPTDPQVPTGRRGAACPCLFIIIKGVEGAARSGTDHGRVLATACLLSQPLPCGSRAAPGGTCRPRLERPAVRGDRHVHVPFCPLPCLPGHHRQPRQDREAVGPAHGQDAGHAHAPQEGARVAAPRGSWQRAPCSGLATPPQGACSLACSAAGLAAPAPAPPSPSDPPARRHRAPRRRCARWWPRPRSTPSARVPPTT